MSAGGHPIPPELLPVGKMFSAFMAVRDRDIARLESLAEKTTGAEVEFHDFGPGGWLLKYQGSLYHDSAFRSDG